jgi:hypothetical protein
MPVAPQNHLPVLPFDRDRRAGFAVVLDARITVVRERGPTGERFSGQTAGRSNRITARPSWQRISPYCGRPETRFPGETVFVGYINNV